jgi:hypothetical protein
MIGPPGLPILGRRALSSAARAALQARSGNNWRWLVGLYIAGVLAHFSHHMAFDLPADGINPSFGIVLASAPMSLVWPADLIHTLIELS